MIKQHIEGAKSFYEKHEVRLSMAFFLAGFLFDVVTLSEVDDLFSIAQQVVYLAVLGAILMKDLLVQNGLSTISPRFEKMWEYRTTLVHFLFGSLLSVYSLFFIKSVSFFSSFLFMAFILFLLVANELSRVQKSGTSLKIAIYFLCVFSFFSILVPVVLGFVGWIPFLLSIVLTAGVAVAFFKALSRRIADPQTLLNVLIRPVLAVLVLFVAFYGLGWIPPVPLSVKKMGVYHKVEKIEGKYRLSHERPWWKFWQTADEVFKARIGDSVVFFAQIYSPARFSDSVTLHWFYKDKKRGWVSADRVPMDISGGRKEGFRAYMIKKNYQPGDWQARIETTDGREIGRKYLEIVETTEPHPAEWNVDER